MNKYTTQQTDLYSRELAKILSDKFFLSRPAINGQELMSFSPVKQVNLLIVKELLDSWHREMANLKSPYFDFDADSVKASLAEFMNVLSQNILIKRKEFEPLAAKAISNTVLLATDAAQFFESAFLADNQTVETEKLRSYLRYLDFGRELFSDFLNDLHGASNDRSFVLQRFKLYLNANYKNQPGTEPLLEQLNQVLPLPSAGKAESRPTAPTENFFEAAPKMASTASPAPQIAPSSAPETLAKPAEPVLPPVTAQKSGPEPVTPLVSQKPVAQVPLPATPEPAIAASTAPSPMPVASTAQPLAPVQEQAKPVKPAAEAPPAGGINDKYKVEHTSLNDKLRKPTVTLADTMGGRKIESLKNSISINQRFAFINELFGGDNQAYHAAINQLDLQPDLESARSFVLDDLSNAFGWNNHGEHVQKLLRLVDRKFA